MPQRLLQLRHLPLRARATTKLWNKSKVARLSALNACGAVPDHFGTAPQAFLL